MALDKSLIEKFRIVTTKAAYAASKFKGLNDKMGADNAAVDVMRKELNKIDMLGRVVIGEGELDEAPMLYIGEELGTKKGIEIDIAVDPVEGTNFVAKNFIRKQSLMMPTPYFSTYTSYPTSMWGFRSEVSRISFIRSEGTHLSHDCPIIISE